VIKTEKPLFAEGEDPSMLDCGGSQFGDASFKKGGAGKRSDKFTHLETVRQEMESKRSEK
jgi:hypothetical protein